MKAKKLAEKNIIIPTVIQKFGVEYRNNESGLLNCSKRKKIEKVISKRHSSIVGIESKYEAPDLNKSKTVYAKKIAVNTTKVFFNLVDDSTRYKNLVRKKPSTIVTKR